MHILDSKSDFGGFFHYLKKAVDKTLLYSVLYYKKYQFIVFLMNSYLQRIKVK